MQVETVGKQLLDSSLNIMKKFTSPIASSQEGKAFANAINSIVENSDKLPSEFKSLMTPEIITKEFNNFGKLGASSIEGVRKAFEEGLVKVNGKWVSTNQWWNDGWDEVFEKSKDGLSKIASEFNPIQSLSKGQLNIDRAIETLKSSSEKAETDRKRNLDDIGRFDKLQEFRTFELGNGETETAKTIRIRGPFHGTEFEKLIVSGADFIPNHYDAAFYWENDKIDNFNVLNAKENETFNFEKAFLNSNGLAVRMESINVPQMKNSTFDVSGVSHTIKKMRSSKDVERKSSFTFRLDRELAFLKLFGQLIGENNFYFGHYLNRKDFVTFFTKSFSNGKISDKHLSLMVALRNLGPAYVKDNNKKYYRIIVFEDVKIIGTDNLQYSSDGGIQTINVEFIYKRLRTLRTGEEKNEQLEGGGYFGEHKGVSDLWTRTA